VLGHLANDKVFIDIGANCGWFSLAAAMTFPSVRIYAIEPVPHTFSRLQRNIELNGRSNIVASNLGLWDR
jgi:FkbM family methyltransferase